jgi:hypothetical protein
MKTLTWSEKVMLYIMRPRYIFNKKVECPSLGFNSKGKAYCKQYSRRPQFCRDYYCK